MSEQRSAMHPRLNPRLLGHTAAESLLLQSWRSGRLPHAWLITGPRGIGKATLAYRFARFVLSGGDRGGAARDLAVDPQNPVFRRVGSGAHPDLRTLERSINEKTGKLRTEIAVDDVREVGGFLRLTPAEGEARVIVVDSADEMSPSAANALLKNLEEPPKRALLLLVSHAPGQLLPTIRSRCHRLSLAPLPEETVLAVLAETQPHLGDEDCAVIARLAEGSIGRAGALAEGGNVELLRSVADLLFSVPRLDVAALHALGDRLGRPGGESAFRTAAELVTWWLGRLVRVGAGAGVPTEVLPGERRWMQRLLAGRSLEQWLGLWEKVAGSFAGAEAVNLDRKQVWIGAFLDIEALARR